METRRRSAISFYFVEDVMDILGVSKSKAYQIINELNRELKTRGIMTVSGRVYKKYFHEKCYCEGSELERRTAL